MPTLDRYVTPLRLPMAIDTFWRFPHLAAYRTEYLDGHAELTYRPRLSMARIAVLPRAERGVAGVAFSRLDVTTHHDALAKLFVAAFTRVPPVDAMPATTRRHAADAALRHTASDGDGAVVPEACLIATDTHDGHAVGAMIVTRIQLRADEWPEPDALPADLVNLTWAFVAPSHQRRGIAGALLDRTLVALAARGVPWLVSHFSVDNPPAVMWHWRNGFELVPGVR